jgi:hypothetical protein
MGLSRFGFGTLNEGPSHYPHHGRLCNQYGRTRDNRSNFKRLDDCPPRGFAFAWFKIGNANIGVYSVHLKSNLVTHGDPVAETLSW